MSAEVVNLRRARKAKAADEKRRGADANRVRFGRTKSEKTAEAAERERAARTIESHRRDRK